MIAVGVDPGSETGLVAVELDRRMEVASARWMAHGVMRPSHRQGWSEAMRDANLAARLEAWFSEVRPDLVVLEEPTDAAAVWRGHFRQQRGTAFRLGAFYGLAVAAAHRAAPGAALHSYPVTNHLGRRGWMRGKRHDGVLFEMTVVAQAIAPAGFLEWRPEGGLKTTVEHVLMALGVLTHHLAQGSMATSLTPAPKRII